MEPDAELTALIAEWGWRWDICPPGPGARCWLAYDRARPDCPAVLADTAGELADRMALLTPNGSRRGLDAGAVGRML